MLRDEFLRLLREDAAFREEVRRQVLTDDLLALPAKVEELRVEMHREFRRTWKAIRKNSRQIAALTQRMERVEAQIQENSRQIAELTKAIGQMEERWGLAHEDIARDLLPVFLRQKGWHVRRVTPLKFDGEVDLVLDVDVGGRPYTFGVEVKGRVWGEGPFEDVLQRILSPKFREAVRRLGLAGPVVPVVFGIIVYEGAEDIARRKGTGLYSPHGEMVAPPIPEADGG